MTELPRLPEMSLLAAEDHEVRLALVIPRHLFWFEGHFRSMPILPGVVQIDWALKIAREYLKLSVPAARRFKVKFRSIIQPGDALTLTLKHHVEKGHLAFEYQRGDLVCSSGQIRTVP